MATKEKQLQLDRKRRAAAFLKAIHSEPGTKGNVVFGPQLPGIMEGTERDEESSSDVITNTPDLLDDGKKDKLKSPECLNNKSLKVSNDRHQRSSSGVRHKHREKYQSKVDKSEKSSGEEHKNKDVNDRISESSISTEEDDSRKRMLYQDKMKRLEDDQWKNKHSEREERNFRKDDKRHKRKKHKKDEFKDRSCSRKHSKSKKQKRSRESDDSRNSRSKRSRRDSSSSSDDPNS